VLAAPWALLGSSWLLAGVASSWWQLLSCRDALVAVFPPAVTSWEWSLVVLCCPVVLGL